MNSTTVSALTYQHPDEKPPTSLGEYRGKIFLVLALACCIGGALRYPFTRDFVTARLSPEMVAEAGGSTEALISFGTVFGLGISAVCVLFVGLGIIHQLSKMAQKNPAFLNLANISIVATVLAIVVPQLLFAVQGLAYSGVIAGAAYIASLAGAAWIARAKLRGLGWKLLLPVFLATILPLVFFGSLFVGVMS